MKKIIWEKVLLKKEICYKYFLIFIYINKEVKIMEKIAKQLKEAGFDYAVAIATEAEINAKAACGQLSIITEDIDH